MGEKIIERAAMKDGTKLFLEDWHRLNRAVCPDLYGYVIAAYPTVKNSGRGKWRIGKDTFRLQIGYDKYNNYTDEMVLADFESLKNGTKTLVDLRKHFDDKFHSDFYLGLTDEEPNW